MASGPASGPRQEPLAPAAGARTLFAGAPLPLRASFSALLERENLQDLRNQRIKPSRPGYLRLMRFLRYVFQFNPIPATCAADADSLRGTIVCASTFQLCVLAMGGAVALRGVSALCTQIGSSHHSDHFLNPCAAQRVTPRRGEPSLGKTTIMGGQPQRRMTRGALALPDGRELGEVSADGGCIEMLERFRPRGVGKGG